MTCPYWDAPYSDMLTRPCAKINLGLNVVRRRADGYHDIETIFYPIPLCDELEMEPAGEDTFELSGIPLDGDIGDNLVLKAVRMFRDEGCNIPPLRVRLRKNIPSGAGLGGGSGDAAFAVRMLNEMFYLGLSADDMRRKVSSLGADCAFFVDAKPVFAEGIGDVLSPIDVDLGGLFLVLVKPDCAVSTRKAYAGVRPRVPYISLCNIADGDIAAWRDTMANDFEESVFPTHPEIADIKERLYLHGAVYASMSGSGSSVYGLFRKPVKVEMPPSCFTVSLTL